MIAVGTRVRLKFCRHGEPGCVVRIERTRAVVLWADIDYLGRHPLESLVEALQKPLQSADAAEMNACK